MIRNELENRGGSSCSSCRRGVVTDVFYVLLDVQTTRPLSLQEREGGREGEREVCLQSRLLKKGVCARHTADKCFEFPTPSGPHLIGRYNRPLRVETLD